MSNTEHVVNVMAVREHTPNDFYYEVGKEGVTQIKLMYVYHGEYSVHEFHIIKDKFHWRTVTMKAVAAFDFMPPGDVG